MALWLHTCGECITQSQEIPHVNGDCAACLDNRQNWLLAAGVWPAAQNGQHSHCLLFFLLLCKWNIIFCVLHVHVGKHQFTDPFCCVSLCVLQMILWDWDLKHWYKPQYQVSRRSLSRVCVCVRACVRACVHACSCARVRTNTTHTIQTRTLRQIESACALLDSSYASQVKQSAHCVRAGAQWPWNRCISLRHSWPCLNYFCKLSRNFVSTERKKGKM